MNTCVKMLDQQINQFRELIWNYYATCGRSFDWRNVEDPYKIVVSEIMLQQTQTHRVATKYLEFIDKFPTFVDLAEARLHEVLSAWQGLGYNRRGKYLHQIAHKVMSEYNGILPDDPEVLQIFPGIGPNTAGSICAFAFNKPIVFIETNIRAVFLHTFFPDQKQVHDKELMPLIQQTVDHDNPREWYYALMDYGVMLKKAMPNPSRKSKHHMQQSKFEGSHRQIRGMILKLLTTHGCLDRATLLQSIDRNAHNIEKAIEELCTEGMICVRDSQILID